MKQEDVAGMRKEAKSFSSSMIQIMQVSKKTMLRGNPDVVDSELQPNLVLQVLSWG